MGAVLGFYFVSETCMRTLQHPCANLVSSLLVSSLSSPQQHLLPTPGAFTWTSPSFFNPNLLHLTLFMVTSVLCCVPGAFPCPSHSQLPNWSACSCYPCSHQHSPLLCTAALDPPPPLKVVGIPLCDVLARSRLMIPSRFASSAHFLCLLLLCVPRSLMQMSSRIFFEAETQGTVWASPCECDTAPFS